MNLSLSLAPRQRLGLYQTEEHQKYENFRKEALKAFRRQEIWNRVFYTCNVRRLIACNRLGDDKQIPLWRTHFFKESRHFFGVAGVIFNTRPGLELVTYTKKAGPLFMICLIVEPTVAIEAQTGIRLESDVEITFASDEQNVQ